MPPAGIQTKAMRSTPCICFAGILIALSFPAHGQSPADRWLTVAQVQRDLDLAEEAYRRVHPGYTRYAGADQLAAAWNEVRSTVAEAKGMSVGDLYLAIERVLVQIRCDHTKAELPKALRDARKVDPVYLPFRWRLVQGRGFVVRSAPDTGLAFGDEILEIDGRSLDRMIETVGAYIPIDGYTTWARSGEVAASLEFSGGAVDHFGALLYRPGSIAKVKVRTGGSEPRTVQVSRINFKEWTALGEARARNFKDAVSFKRVGRTAAVLRIDTFVNYRDPVEPDDLFAPIFKTMRKEGRTNLILDLRRNGGGSNEPARELMRYLISDSMRLYTDMRVATLDLDGLRQHLWTWDKRALRPNRLGFRRNDDGTYSLRRFVDEDLQTIRRRRRPFTGRLIVLTSPDNSSGSTVLAAFLKARRGAVLIGETTGGSPDGPTAGLLFTLTLPESGIKTRLPFIRYTTNIPRVKSGYGLAPDVKAPLTVEAFLARRDPAMDTALAVIEAD